MWHPICIKPIFVWTLHYNNLKIANSHSFYVIQYNIKINIKRLYIDLPLKGHTKRGSISLRVKMFLGQEINNS